MSEHDDDKKPATVPQTETRPPSPFGDAEGLGDETAEAAEPSSVETELPDEPEPPVKKPRWGRRILFAVVLLVFVFGAGLFTMPQIAPRLATYLPASLVYGEGMTGRLEALESRVATLESAGAQRDPAIAELQASIAKTAATAQDVAARLDGLSIPDLSPDIAAVNAKLLALSTSATAADDETRRAIANEIAVLADRLTAMEANLSQVAAAAPAAPSTSDGGVDSAAVATLRSRMAAAERAVADVRRETQRLNQTLADAQTETSARHAALESRVETLATTPRADDGSRISVGSAFVLAVSQLRGAVVSGNPYGTELDALQALATGSRDETLSAALVSLAAGADNGITSLDDLRATYADAAQAALRASRSRGEGWVAQTMDRLSSVVSVRRVGEVAGDDAEAVLARAETRLNAGDIQAALTELEALTGPAAEAMAAWTARAKAHAGAHRALRDLQTLAIAGLKG